MSRSRLIVFVKAPRPGAVKTRLAKSIGAAEAARAYCLLAERLFLNLQEVPGVELRFSPDDAQAEIRPWLRPGWTSSPQGEGNLGDRLHRAIAAAFKSGCEKTAVIGSDCPSVTAADINDAWNKLADNDVVLGPAEDGGYWLIAVRAPQPALFTGIDWSTDRVLAQSLAAARDARLKVAQLSTRQDIDTIVEWNEWRARRPQ